MSRYVFVCNSLLLRKKGVICSLNRTKELGFGSEWVGWRFLLSLRTGEPGEILPLEAIRCAVLRTEGNPVDFENLVLEIGL